MVEVGRATKIEPLVKIPVRPVVPVVVPELALPELLAATEPELDAAATPLLLAVVPPPPVLLATVAVLLAAAAPLLLAATLAVLLLAATPLLLAATLPVELAATLPEDDAATPLLLAATPLLLATAEDETLPVPEPVEVDEVEPAVVIPVQLPGCWTTVGS